MKVLPVLSNKAADENDCMMKSSTVTYGRYEVGGGGGHSGSGGGRGVPESFIQEGPHHSVAGEEQASAQQPQRDVKLGHKNTTRLYYCA